MTDLQIKSLKVACYFVLYSIILFYIFRIFTFAFFGIDFSDEGRHLNEIKYASSYSWSASQYGSVLHPIAQFLNYNIPYLRILNLTITFLLSIWIGRIQIRKSDLFSQKNKCYSLAYSLVVGLLGLTFFNIWLPTPSYYSLTFQSLILYWISFKLLNLEELSSIKPIAMLLFSFSSALVFVSKPTAFLIVWMISMYSISLFTASRIKHSIQYNSLLLFFLVATSLVFFKSPFGIFERIRIASRLMAIQDPAYRFDNIFRLDPLPYRFEFIFLLFFLVILLVGITISITKFRFRNSLFQAIILMVILTSTAITFRFIVDSSPSPNILLVSLLLFAVSLFVLNSRFEFKRREFFLNSNLILLPFAYALGSNGNLWAASTQAIFFFVLFAFWLMSFIRERTSFAFSQILFVGLTVSLSIYSIEYGVSNPYRQLQALDLQKASAIQDKNLVGIRLSAPIEAKLNYMYISAEEVGLQEGTSIIDFTGQSPLAIFALKAYPVGSPWMVGGYAGSNDLAKEVLREVDCQVLTESWVLLEPGGPRSLDVDGVLGSLGFSLNEYSHVTSWNTPRGAGGFVESRLQKLYKPLHAGKDLREARCELHQAK